ncbi:MAG: hypothetical protein Q9201_005414, partial [Fulgogasparrea decipioides]
MAKDEYLAYIPCTWTPVNNCRGNPLSGKFLWEMMVLSMLNYHVDKFIEAVVGEAFKNSLELVSDLIKDTCRHISNFVEGYNISPETEQTCWTNGPSKKCPRADVNGNTSESANKKTRTTRIVAAPPTSPLSAAPPISNPCKTTPPAAVAGRSEMRKRNTDPKPSARIWRLCAGSTIITRSVVRDRKDP